MKICYLTPLLLVFPLSIHATSVELWTDGVSRSGGWSDFNKANPYAGDGDDNLCWAAAASNIIHWWQQKYQIPSGTPSGEAVWTTFKNSFTDLGSGSKYAFEWWLGGTFLPVTQEWDKHEDEAYRHASFKAGAANGGYYKNYLEPASAQESYWGYTVDSSNYIASASSFEDLNSYAFLSTNIRDFLENGAGLTISIADTFGRTSHALTLWGIEYDTSTNLITKMWLTDSDDEQYNYNIGENALFEVVCEAVTVETQVGSQGTLTETMLGFKTNSNRWYDYGDGRQFYVTGVDGLLPADFLVPIPEPSAFGFLAGLAALALAGTRRSRKSFKK